VVLNKSLRMWLFLGAWLMAGPAYANGDALGRARLLFLERQYVQSIDECAAVIRSHPDDRGLIADANYLAGTGYVNLFDFLTAKKNFKTVVEKYKGTAAYEDAYLGWGDVEFLQENYAAALKVYEDFLKTNPSKKRLATLYFRLSETYLREGQREESDKYLKKLKNEFGGTFEARDARRIAEKDIFYTVQVGAFTNYENAEKFIAKLRAQGYEVYSVLCMLSGKKLCRIRIGKFKTEAEAEALKRKLEQGGYYAKVFPRDEKD
jgi:tetratricopeptide (TPR) repeat protein